MSVRSAVELLAHMREAAGQGGDLCRWPAKEDFLADKRTQQAVILNLIILGEAATKLLWTNRPAVAEAELEIGCAAPSRAHAQPDRDGDTILINACMWCGESGGSALPELVEG